MYRRISIFFCSVLLYSCSQNSYTYKERSSDIQASRQAGLFVKEYQLTTLSDLFVVQEAWIERIGTRDEKDKTPNEPGYRFCINLLNNPRAVSLFERKSGEAVGQFISNGRTYYTYAGSAINDCAFGDSLHLIVYKDGSETPPTAVSFTRMHK